MEGPGQEGEIFDVDDRIVLLASAAQSILRTANKEILFIFTGADTAERR